jgi:hypothetical protein
MAKRKTNKKVVLKGSSNRTSGWVLDGISIMDMATVACIATEDLMLGTLKYLIAGFISVIIMIQLRLSVPQESPEFMDKLPSYRKYKSSVMKGPIGAIVATCYGIFKSLPVINDPSPETIDDILISYTDSPVTNAKRYPSPTSTNWQNYLAGPKKFLRQWAS